MKNSISGEEAPLLWFLIALFILLHTNETQMQSLERKEVEKKSLRWMISVLTCKSISWNSYKLVIVNISFVIFTLNKSF